MDEFKSMTPEAQTEYWKSLDESAKHEFVMTPAGIEYAVKAYHFAKERRENVFPGLSGLLMFLDVSDDEYEEMLNRPEINKWFVYAKRRRSQYLEQTMLNNGKMAPACKLLLSQPENGGYGDKAPEKKPKQMKVLLNGIEAKGDSDDN